MSNIIYVKQYFTEKFNDYIDRIDYLKIDKYACTVRNIFYTDGTQQYSKITNRVINIFNFSYIIFVDRYDENKKPRFVLKLRDLNHFKEAEDKLEELIEYYTSQKTKQDMAVVRMELDYWLSVLHEALQDNDEQQVNEAKEKLRHLRHRALVLEML